MNNGAIADRSALLTPTEALAFLNEQRTSQHADTQEEAHITRTLAFFGVRLTTFGLLFDEKLDKELIAQSHIRSVPNSPTWLEGFSNIRGAITPVLNLYRLFGQERIGFTPLTRPYLLVLGKGSRAFALPLIQLPEKLTFDHNDSHSDQALAPVVLKPFIEACYRTNVPWFSIRYNDFLNHLKDCP